MSLRQVSVWLTNARRRIVPALRQTACGIGTAAVGDGSSSNHDTCVLPAAVRRWLSARPLTEWGGGTEQKIVANDSSCHSRGRSWPDGATAYARTTSEARPAPTMRRHAPQLTLTSQLTTAVGSSGVATADAPPVSTSHRSRDWYETASQGPLAQSTGANPVGGVEQLEGVEEPLFNAIAAIEGNHADGGVAGDIGAGAGAGSECLFIRELERHPETARGKRSQADATQLEAIWMPADWVQVQACDCDARAAIYSTTAALALQAALDPCASGSSQVPVTASQSVTGVGASGGEPDRDGSATARFLALGSSLDRLLIQKQQLVDEVRYVELLEQSVQSALDSWPVPCGFTV